MSPEPNPIKLLRGLTGLSFVAVASRAGPDVSRQTVAHYERLPRLDGLKEGERVTLGVLVKIAEAMDVPIKLQMGEVEVDLKGEFK